MSMLSAELLLSLKLWVVLPWSSATAPLATAGGEVSLLGSTPSRSSATGSGGGGMEAAAVSVDVSDTDSANHSLETLELLWHPTAVFSSLDENVAVCPVQVHD